MENQQTQAPRYKTMIRLSGICFFSIGIPGVLIRNLEKHKIGRLISVVILAFFYLCFPFVAGCIPPYFIFFSSSCMSFICLVLRGEEIKKSLLLWGGREISKRNGMFVLNLSDGSASVARVALFDMFLLLVHVLLEILP